MKKILTLTIVVLVLLFLLASCSFRGCTPQCRHEWDGGVLINATECGEGAIARFTCLKCGETNQGSVKNHKYVSGNKVDPTCTSMGYTEYECARCNATCVSDFVNALGHKYGEETVVKEETCTSRGSYVRICENCGDQYSYFHNARGHSYQIVAEYDTNTTYECENCSDVVVLDKEQSIEEFVGANYLFDVEPTFSFDIMSFENEEAIRNKLKIVDYYFYETEYEDFEDVTKEYILTYKGDNIWTVSVLTDYEYDTTYIATIREGIAFVDYKCKELVFTVTEDPDHNNIYEFHEGIIFLQALENENPGYYPYKISSTLESEYLYLALNKVDGLAKGQVICVGDITSADQITSDSDECYFGKIYEFYPLPDGSWMVVLSEPDLAEIFSELDINFNGEINFDNENIDIERLEGEIIDQLYYSEDFIKFLSSMNISANKYYEENGYYAEELADLKSFLDKMEIDPDFKVNGTTITATVKGELNLPIKDQNKNEIGHFKVSFSVKMENVFDIDLNYQIKWKWFLPNLKTFDLAITQSTVLGFDFNVSIEVDYSLEENKYVQNKESNKIHRSTCPHINKMDNKKLEGLTVVKAEKLLKEHPEWGCKHCQPIKGFNKDLLVINMSEKRHGIHAYNCIHVAQMSESNKLLSEEKASYWIMQGYTCCDWCFNENREEKEFEAIYVNTLYSSDWQQVATDITQIFKDMGASERTQKGVTIVQVNVPIYGLITARFEINCIFNFKLEASFKYEYSSQQRNVYGVRLVNKGVHTYANKGDPVVTKNQLTVMGKAEIRAGFQVGVGINIKGLSKWLNAGVTADFGMYAKISGILSMSSTSNDNYTAGYLEIGAFLDVSAYYKLVIWGGNGQVYSKEWVLSTWGFANAYFAYENYYDKLVINGSYDIDAENLLAVKYFDLKTMKVNSSELSLNERSKYKVQITFADGSYCQIKNGKIVAKSDAPCYFTDTMTITVDCDDTWKKYNPNSAVYYLGIYEIEIEFHVAGGGKHTYSSESDEYCDYCNFERCVHKNVEVLASKDATCTTTGLTEGAKCTNCGEIVVNQEVISAFGHTIEIIPAIESTCTEKGWTEGQKCIVCEAVLIDPKPVPLKPHTEVIDKGYEATCTSTGLTDGKHCSVCNTVLVKQEIIDILPHPYTKVVIEPTCTEKGTITYTCACGDSYFEYVDALGHYFSEWRIVIVPTIFSEGLRERNCACGETETEIIEKIVSIGLEYTINSDGQSYSLTGIGTCADTDIGIPETYENLPVTSIYFAAFSGCTSLTSIVIPDSVTSIGSSAFNGCTSLTSIVIPDSVTSIDEYAFRNCSSLTSIEIPDSVTSIGEDAFSGCTSLTSIVIPDSVTSIGYGAFSGCSSLTSIEIPDSVTSIGEYTFLFCTSLTSIVIPDSVTSIGYGAFWYCTSLPSIEIPDSVTSISSHAFYGCSSLTSIVVLDSVINIGERAFDGCTSLTIYCEAESQPSGWNSYWNSSNRPVEWGYKPEN